MEGKGQSPFDPAHKNTAVLVGECQASWSIPTSAFSSHCKIWNMIEFPKRQGTERRSRSLRTQDLEENQASQPPTPTGTNIRRWKETDRCGETRSMIPGKGVRQRRELGFSNMFNKCVLVQTSPLVFQTWGWVLKWLQRRNLCNHAFPDTNHYRLPTLTSWRRWPLTFEQDLKDIR